MEFFNFRVGRYLASYGGDLVPDILLSDRRDFHNQWLETEGLRLSSWIILSLCYQKVVWVHRVDTL